MSLRWMWVTRLRQIFLRESGRFPWHLRGQGGDRRVLRVGGDGGGDLGDDGENLGAGGGGGTRAGGRVGKAVHLGLGGIDASGVLCESLGRGKQVCLRGGARGHRLHTVVLGLFAGRELSLAVLLV